MSKHKFLVLMRMQPSEAGNSDKAAPSPEQMQKMFAAYNAWNENFKDAIHDMGGKLTLITAEERTLNTQHNTHLYSYLCLTIKELTGP